MTLEIRRATPADRAWIRAAVSREWSTPFVVSRGRGHRADELPGLVAMEGPEAVGLLTYRLDGEELEVVTLQAFRRRCGVGRRLIDAARRIAGENGCRRLWLVTTNDNTAAQQFYRAVGMRLAAVHPGAVRESRALKPQIPLLGLNGIPIEDEVEFETEP